jgi:hypothetical protein
VNQTGSLCFHAKQRKKRQQQHSTLRLTRACCRRQHQGTDHHAWRHAPFLGAGRTIVASTSKNVGLNNNSPPPLSYFSCYTGTPPIFSVQLPLSVRLVQCTSGLAVGCSSVHQQKGGSVERSPEEGAGQVCEETQSFKVAIYKAHLPCIMANPKVTKHALPASARYLVMASDGVWGHMSSREVAVLVLKAAFALLRFRTITQTLPCVSWMRWSDVLPTNECRRLAGLTASLQKLDLSQHTRKNLIYLNSKG